MARLERRSFDRIEISASSVICSRLIVKFIHRDFMSHILMAMEKLTSASALIFKKRLAEIYQDFLWLLN
jgi:hypothetical protein